MLVFFHIKFYWFILNISSLHLLLFQISRFEKEKCNNGKFTEGGQAGSLVGFKIPEPHLDANNYWSDFRMCSLCAIRKPFDYKKRIGWIIVIALQYGCLEIKQSNSSAYTHFQSELQLSLSRRNRNPIKHIRDVWCVHRRRIDFVFF